MSSVLLGDRAGARGRLVEFINERGSWTLSETVTSYVMPPPPRKVILPAGQVGPGVGSKEDVVGEAGCGLLPRA